MVIVLAVVLWFLFFKRIRTRQTLIFLSTIYMLTISLQIMIIIHSLHPQPFLSRLISIIGTTSLFLVILVNLGVLDVFTSIRNTIEVQKSEKTQKILAVCFACTFGTLWLDLIPSDTNAIRIVQRLLAVIWISTSVLYDSFLSFYLQYIVYKTTTTHRAITADSPLLNIIQWNVMVLVLDWMYIALFITGQFVYSFEDVGMDLRQGAVAMSGFHVLGKTFVLYRLMDLVITRRQRRQPQPPLVQIQSIHT
jgi:hypothetical protein